jgi:hypothetical protein
MASLLKAATAAMRRLPGYGVKLLDFVRVTGHRQLAHGVDKLPWHPHEHPSCRTRYPSRQVTAGWHRCGHGAECAVWLSITRRA